MSVKKDTETNQNSNNVSGNDLNYGWVNHPAAYNGKRTVLVCLFLVLVFVTVYFTTNSPVLTSVAVLIMLGSLSSFFLPTKFKMDGDGIHIKTVSGQRSYNWNRFRSFYPDRHGVLLSPFTRPSRLENFRGVYIRFTDNRNEVLNRVERMIDRSKTQKDDGNAIT